MAITVWRQTLDRRFERLQTLQLQDELTPTQAQAAAADLLSLWPEFEAGYCRRGLTNWLYSRPGMTERIPDGLRKAGLEMMTD